MLFISYILPVLNPYLVASMEVSSVPPRFGLSFGTATVTASRYNTSGVYEITKFPTSVEYSNYYQTAVQFFDSSQTYSLYPNDSEPDFGALFTTTIDSVYTELTQQIGHTPEISSVWIPPVFGTRFRDVLHNAAYKLTQGDFVEYTHTSGCPVKAACWAYDFLSGKHLNRTAEQCQDLGPYSAILALEYEEEYLHVWWVEPRFERHDYGHRKGKMSKELGAKHRGKNTYQERVAAFLTAFVDENLSTENKATYESTFTREDIRAIFVFGDAAPAAVDELRSIARDVVGTDIVKVLDEFKASEVVARGAAAWSRWTDDNPDGWWVSNVPRMRAELEEALNSSRWEDGTGIGGRDAKKRTVKLLDAPR